MSATSGSDDPEGDDGRGPNYRGQSRDAGEDEGTAAAASVLVGGGGGIVAAHHLVDAAQLPECVLETPAALQDQEGLPGGHLGVAPPRVAEDQLEQQVGMGLAGDGHTLGVAVGKVDLGFPSRRMFLGEVDLLVRMVQCPPVL